MSTNEKRCSSGTVQTLGSVKQNSTLSRAKTCGVTSTLTLKSKPERLQPLTTNKPALIDDQTLVKLVFISNTIGYYDYFLFR